MGAYTCRHVDVAMQVALNNSIWQAKDASFIRTIPVTWRETFMVATSEPPITNLQTEISSFSA